MPVVGDAAVVLVGYHALSYRVDYVGHHDDQSPTPWVVIRR